MGTDRGFFLVSRGLFFGESLWQERPEILRLALYLIGKARYKLEPENNGPIEIKRGEVITSLTIIANDCLWRQRRKIVKWSKFKTSLMLRRLVELEFISKISGPWGLHVRILNYDLYQNCQNYIAPAYAPAIHQQFTSSSPPYAPAKNENSGLTAEYHKENQKVEKVTCNMAATSLQHGCNMAATWLQPKEEREERNTGKERETKTGERVEAPGDTQKKCPTQEIIDIYHTECPELPRVRSFNRRSQMKLRNLWRECEVRQSSSWWQEFFRDEVARSDFLSGRVKEFRADLDWIIEPSNFQKILNGRYRNRDVTVSTTKQAHNLVVLKNWVAKGGQND